MENNKAKRKSKSPVYYNPPAIAMPSGPLGMHQSQHSGTYTMMEQRFVLSPSVASNLEEAVAHSTKTSRINPAARLIVLEYLGAEDPQKRYTDINIIKHARSKGHEITQADIIYARALIRVGFD